MLTNGDIIRFYKSLEQEISQSAIHFRIHQLVKKGVLHRTGRGRYSLQRLSNYIPETTKEIAILHKTIQKEFPFIDLCIWRTSIINEFMIHQPGLFLTLVETERDTIDSLFYFLKEKKYPVLAEPTEEIMDKYLPWDKEPVILTPLVTEAPTLQVDNIITVSLEKMLVDIFCDNVIFSAQQGNEMDTIFIKALSTYAVNQSKMVRYADRKGRKEELRKYLKSISTKRQNISITAKI